MSSSAGRPLDEEHDIIYVYCDNIVQNSRKEDMEVRLIAQEFHRLMWDVEDV